MGRAGEALAASGMPGWRFVLILVAGLAKAQTVSLAVHSQLTHLEYQPLA
jgi:hypothetical protein